MFPLESLKSRMTAACGQSLPKGEVWLGTGLFEQMAMEDTAENHIRMAEHLDHALVCLPVCQSRAVAPELGYRYFNVRDVTEAAELSDKPVAAVIDGPFQQMVNQIGLMQVFASWMRDRESLTRTYTRLTEEAMGLVAGVLEHPVAALIVADDLASESGPLVRPSDLETLCTPFYTRLATAARERGIPVFLHSCGKLDRLVPLFKGWQINGFAAIQSRINDLTSLYNEFEGGIMVMGGIELDLLDRGDLAEEDSGRLETAMASLGTDLILCSSCGLYEGRFYTQVRKLYTAVQRMRL